MKHERAADHVRGGPLRGVVVLTTGALAVRAVDDDRHRQAVVTCRPRGERALRPGRIGRRGRRKHKPKQARGKDRSTLTHLPSPSIVRPRQASYLPTTRGSLMTAPRY